MLIQVKIYSHADIQDKIYSHADIQDKIYSSAVSKLLNIRLILDEVQCLKFVYIPTVE